MVDLFGESITDVPYYFLREYELDGLHVYVSRTGYTAELGYEIYLQDASRHGAELWDKVLEAGKPHDLRVIGPCHIKRIEAGILALGPGCDMWFDTNPYEVEMGYEWMVDLEQEADFIGKEALRRIKADGVKRKLVGVEIGGEPLGAYNDGTMVDVFPVFADGREIGKVTSACYSPRLERNIGFAMVPIEYAELGSELETETPHGRTSAVTARRQFIDPEKETPKQEVTVGAEARTTSDELR
jgi:glycine cleavage system aminomethyltransferase T